MLVFWRLGAETGMSEIRGVYLIILFLLYNCLQNIFYIFVLTCRLIAGYHQHRGRRRPIAEKGRNWLPVWGPGCVPGDMEPWQRECLSTAGKRIVMPHGTARVQSGIT